MPRSAFVRPRHSEDAPATTSQVRHGPPTLRPLERPPLSAARGVLLAVVLGALAWAAAIALYWQL